MAKRTPIYVAASLSLVIASAACSNSSGAGRDSAATPAESTRTSRGTFTVEGCLSAGTDGRMVLTAAPDAAGATAARIGMGTDRETHSYVLLGGENLQAHLGKRVQIAGTLVGDTQDLEQTEKAKSESAPASAGGETPTVKTKEEIDVEIRQLNVANVRELAPTCKVNP